MLIPMGSIRYRFWDIIAFNKKLIAMLFYVSRRYTVTLLYLFKKVSSTDRPKGPKNMPSERDSFSYLVRRGQPLVDLHSFNSLCQQVKQVVGVSQTDGVCAL